ncbi:MAG: hypothetical protein ACFCD0_11825 [Gemmataceae bacterium]
MPSDPMSEPRRVHFQERQILRAADLSAVQQYHRDGRLRHQSSAHSAGIVAGLVLALPTQNNSPKQTVILSPGMALDHEGREIFVSSPHTLEVGVNVAEENGNEVPNDISFSIWVGYKESLVETSMSDVPDSDQECKGGRTIEGYQVCSILASKQDSMAPSWVCLGGIYYNRRDKKWEVRDDGRLYVHVKASEVMAASGRTRVLLSPQETDDPRRFAVGVRSDNAPTPEASISSIPDYNDRLLIHADKTARIVGRAFLAHRNTTSSSILFVGPVPNSARCPQDDSRAATHPGITFEGQREAPERALPGQIYRVLVQDKEKKTKRQELRIEFDNPGKEDNPKHYRCVFGIEGRSPNSFVGVLKIKADKTVEIEKDLVIPEKEGQLIEAFAPSDPSDPATQTQLATALTPGDIRMKIARATKPPLQQTVYLEIELGNYSPEPLRAIHLTGVAIKKNSPAIFQSFKHTEAELTKTEPKTLNIGLANFAVAPQDEIEVRVFLAGLGPVNNVIQQQAKEDKMVVQETSS